MKLFWRILKFLTAFKDVIIAKHLEPFWQSIVRRRWEISWLDASMKLWGLLKVSIGSSHRCTVRKKKAKLAACWHMTVSGIFSYPDLRWLLDTQQIRHSSSSRSRIIGRWLITTQTVPVLSVLILPKITTLRLNPSTFVWPERNKTPSHGLYSHSRM